MAEHMPHEHFEAIIGHRVNLAWQRYHLSHNHAPHGRYGGFLLWARDNGGTVKIRPSMEDSDETLKAHPTRLSVEFQTAERETEAWFSVAPDEEMHYSPYAERPTDNEHCELLMLLHDAPQAAQEQSPAPSESQPTKLPQAVGRTVLRAA